MADMHRPVVAMVAVGECEIVFPVLTTRSCNLGATPDPGTSLYAMQFIEESRIGSGSFGEVFRVRARRDNQLYAIKKSRPFTSKADRSAPP